jgi:cytosine/adenosine deaminase-related metal-dependent hydrolase
MIVAGRALLLDARTWVDGGGLEVEGGVVRRVLRSRRAALRARANALRWRDLDGLVLTPGLVDAHAHLDLGALRGRIAPGPDFVSWIRALISARARLSGRDLERGVRAGTGELLASGTTAIGDVDASGASARLAPGLGPRIVVYREVLDVWNPARTAAALRLVRAGLPARARVREGLSPHAPYTTSRRLLARAREIAGRRGLALSIHWAESREEGRWLLSGAGALAALLPPSPRCSGLELLDAAGLLTPRTSLVHGNFPAAGEPELLARRGVTLVHCPGTHDFFERSRFPLERYRAAGVPLALGTDSLASNRVLDMRCEMMRLRASFPRLAPAEAFAMATEGGARALGLPSLGHARPGAAADLAAWRLAARTRAAALEELTAACPPVVHVLLAGRELRLRAAER